MSGPAVLGYTTVLPFRLGGVAQEGPVEGRVLEVCRRAFPESQRLLAGETVGTVDHLVTVGWYDAHVHPESGAFAVVRTGGPLLYLVGEILRVSRTSGGVARAVYVYCVAARHIEQDLALYRRAFLSLGNLARGEVDCRVEVVG